MVYPMYLSCHILAKAMLHGVGSLGRFLIRSGGGKGRRGIIVLIDKPHGYLLALLAEGRRRVRLLFII